MRTVTAYVHHKDSPKRRIEIHENGKKVGGELVNPSSTLEIERRITKPFRIPAAIVLQACDALTVAVEVPDENALPTGPLVVYLRGRGEPSDAATAVTLTDEYTFGTFVNDSTVTLPPECLVEWRDVRLGYLDIDVEHAIHPVEAERIASQVRPRPRWWHQSRSGGLHLYYEAACGFEALDLAACAAVWVRQWDSRLRCELKTVTHHPALTGKPWHEQTPTPDVGHVLAWLKCDSADVDTSAVLGENGWTVGNRLPHTQCPIDSRPTSGNDPVVVNDDGIYCFTCASAGLSLGSNRAGFVPFSYYVGSGLRSTLQDCVRNFTHWSHARIVFASQLDVPDALARRCYRVMLAMWHGSNDPRIDRAMVAGDGLIRRKGYWQYVDGAAFKVQHGKRELSSLPAVQNDKGEAIGSVVDRFCQSTDLSSHGYAPIDIVHGVKLWGHHLPYADRRIVTVRYNGPDESRPRYLPPPHRLSEDETREVYHHHFPYVPWEYLQLLIAARGVAEGGQGMPPFIYCWGASGAGKTQTVHIAAGTIGDSNTEVNWSHDTQRFRQGVQEAVTCGTFCTVNEIKKSAQRVRMEIDLALEPLLTLTEHSTSHQLYVGPVTLGRVPVVVMTETTAPLALLRSEQLVRRLVNVHLPHRLDWDQKAGANATRVREIGEKMRHAADSLLSWVIDKHLREPLTIFQIAERLGFERMEDYAHNVTGIEETLRAFFDAVCAAPDADASDQKRWGGKGWKKCDQSRGNDTRNELDHLYLTLSDPTDFTTSTRILETDWSRLLNFGRDAPHVECQIRPISPRHKSVVGVRFRQGDKLNGEITA